MFLCRGAKSFASSSFSYYVARSVQVATNKTQVALRNSSIISCSRVGHRGANNVDILCVPSEMLLHTSGGSNKYKYVSHTWTACKSVSTFGSILPFSWRSASLNTTDHLTLPNSFSCLGADTRIIHFSTQKLLSSALSSASNQKQANWTQGEPVTEVPKSSQGGAEKPEPEEKQDKTKQLRRVFKEYGAVGVSFHVGISLISLGIFYIAVSSGINMTDVLSKLGFSETVLQSKMAAGTSTFVLAYAIHKLFAPFRISITLVSVPLIVRYLRKIGLFKSSQPRL